MDQSPVMHGPKCSKCKQPMIWKCVQLVQAQPMNVFQCNVCERLFVLAAEAIADMVV
jgi:hypothetical protein